MASTTLTIRISEETKAKLDHLARLTRRSKSFLVARLLDDQIDREIEICEGILDSIADIEAGRMVPHEEVVANMKRLIADTHARHHRKSIGG